MPKDTFIKLPQEKKDKIINAAKREFSRASLRDASIKNIVEEAEIARGSFYQYFESKEDLLQYLLKEHVEEMNENVLKTIKETNGDIFKVFISIYDYMIKECTGNKEANLFKKIIEEIKTSQDDIFIIDLKKHKPKNIDEYYNLINKTNLKINGEEEFKLLTRILHAVTKKAVVSTFKYGSRKKAKEDFLKQLEYIKYGVIKPEFGDVFQNQV